MTAHNWLAVGWVECNETHAARFASTVGNPTQRGSRKTRPTLRDFQSPIPGPWPLTPVTPRRAFTLVELLVVITVIGILSSISMVAIGHVRTEARIAKTKATIAKIDQIIQRRYESYRTRRVPVNMSALATLPDPTLKAKKMAEVRLAALRALMAMEMPDRMGDITTSPGVPIPLPYGTQMTCPTAAVRFAAIFNDPKLNTNMIHATMLYQVVMSDPQNASFFSADEIGDPNGDGLPEFLDGWGRPIYWLRWAPAFTPYSDIQKAGNIDPFDSRSVDTTPDLIPLIYSAGPDKLFGVNAGKGEKPPAGVQFLPKTLSERDTFWRIASRSEYTPIGQPDPAEPGAMNDNIHNHHIEQR